MHISTVISCLTQIQASGQCIEYFKKLHFQFKITIPLKISLHNNTQWGTACSIILINYDRSEIFTQIWHQQKIKKLICGYIAIYSDKINSNIEIQVFKYIRIHRTSKMHITTRNVYSAIHATVYKVLCEMPRIQEHVLSLYNLL